MLNPRKPPILRSDERGVALTEFALTLPLFLILMMGGLEVTNLALVHLRLNHIAESTADNASRVRSQMDENDVEEIFAGLQKEGAPIDFDNKGDVVLSSVEDNKQTGAKKGQTIRWQRCHGKKKNPPKYGKEGKGKSDNALKDGIGPPGKQVGAQPGTAVMFVEVSYDYQPMIFERLIGSRKLRYESAFNVRERTELGITNVRGKPVKSC
jgi:hypothetical protein